MTLVMSCRCLSQSCVGGSIGGECALSVSRPRPATPAGDNPPPVTCHEADPAVPQRAASEIEHRHASVTGQGTTEHGSALSGLGQVGPESQGPEGLIGMDRG